MTDGDEEDLTRYRFGLTLEVGSDDTLDISLFDVPRSHIPYMFSTTIADVITTTLMDMSMMPDEPPDAYEPDEDEQ